MANHEDIKKSLALQIEETAKASAAKDRKLDELVTMQELLIKHTTIIEKNPEWIATVKTYRDMAPQYLQRWAIASTVCIADTPRCQLLGINYTSKDYRKVRDHPKKQFLENVAASSLVIEEAEKPSTALSDDALLSYVGKIIRSSKTREADKIKATETYLKLREKIEGSTTLKPWQKNWVQIITPIIKKEHAISSNWPTV
tara:strand:+ start:291 stop:890 length:600 start_codon:yes stop_codon:yes gene_type:complete